MNNTEQKVMLKSSKISKILIIVSLSIFGVGLLLGILALVTKNGALGTVCAVIGVIGGFLGVGIIATGLVNKADYCPQCGAKIRKTQTFTQRIEGKRSDTTSGYSIPYINYYDCTNECALCGWHKEYTKKENAGKLFYANSNGRLMDSVKEPRADFDTGYPDNSELENLSPEVRLNKVKLFSRTCLIIGLIMIALAVFMNATSASVEKSANETQNEETVNPGIENLPSDYNPSTNNGAGSGDNHDNSNNDSGSNDNTTTETPVIDYEVDESEWRNAFWHGRLANVTMTGYMDDYMYSKAIIASGYIESEEYDENGNRTYYGKATISNDEIEENVGFGLKELYSYFEYNTETKSYEYSGLIVQFENGYVTLVSTSNNGVNHIIKYSNYGTSEVS